MVGSPNVAGPGVAYPLNGPALMQLPKATSSKVQTVTYNLGYEQDKKQ